MAASAPSRDGVDHRREQSRRGERPGGVVHADDRRIGRNCGQPGAHRLAARRAAGDTALALATSAGGTTTTTPSLTAPGDVGSRSMHPPRAEQLVLLGAAEP